MQDFQDDISGYLQFLSLTQNSQRRQLTITERHAQFFNCEAESDSTSDIQESSDPDSSEIIDEYQASHEVSNLNLPAPVVDDTHENHQDHSQLSNESQLVLLSNNERKKYSMYIECPSGCENN